MTKLIIALGNPGKQYEKTRHNIGWSVLDAYLKDNFPFDTFSHEKKFFADIVKVKENGQNLIFVKPQTFMNDSGKSVNAIMQFYKCSPKDLIIIHDDLDLDLGVIRISKNQSSGGHNGIKSIIQMISSKEFIRLKIGINSKKRNKIPTKAFVLQPFGLFEKSTAKKATQISSKALKCLLNEDIQICMNTFN